MNPIIFGIDPGTREMGTAVIRGKELLAFGVHTLRNGERPYDVIG
jgi:RNase H-fold protein (predicted Holliday junction resolvase)